MDCGWPRTGRIVPASGQLLRDNQQGCHRSLELITTFFSESAKGGRSRCPSAPGTGVLCSLATRWASFYLQRSGSLQNLRSQRVEPRTSCPIKLPLNHVGISRGDNNRCRLLDSSKAPIKVSYELSSTSTARTRPFNQQRAE